MRSPIRDYFDFSRKEQVGLMMLIGIILACIVILNFHEFFFPRQPVDITEKEQVLIAALEAEREVKEARYYPQQTDSNANTGKKRLEDPFPFDPNTLDADGYIKLGFSEKQAQSIRNYLAKGGRIYKVEDFKKLYVVNDFMYDRLKDFIRIEERIKSRTEKRSYGSDSDAEAHESNQVVNKEPPVKALVNINGANKQELMAIRGIGPIYAKNIMKYREIHWGFTSLNQLGEVYGIQDHPEIIADLKTQLMVGEYKAVPININTCEWVDLIRVPYIEKEVANSILAIRKTHGNYAEVSDIKRSHLISEELYVKISPYLTVDSR